MCSHLSGEKVGEGLVGHGLAALADRGDCVALEELKNVTNRCAHYIVVR
jgi:hypothetical protein